MLAQHISKLLVWVCRLAPALYPPATPPKWQTKSFIGRAAKKYSTFFPAWRPPLRSPNPPWRPSERRYSRPLRPFENCCDLAYSRFQAARTNFQTNEKIDMPGSLVEFVPVMLYCCWSVFYFFDYFYISNSIDFILNYRNINHFRFIYVEYIKQSRNIVFHIIWTRSVWKMMYFQLTHDVGFNRPWSAPSQHHLKVAAAAHVLLAWRLQIQARVRHHDHRN